MWLFLSLYKETFTLLLWFLSSVQETISEQYFLQAIFKVGLPSGGTIPSSTWKIRFSSKSGGIQSFLLFSLKWMMMNLFLTSSLFSVNSSYITLPSKMIKSSSFCCCLFRVRNEAWGDLINTTHSLERSSSLKSWSITRMLLIFLTSAIFRSLPWTWSMSRLALVLSFSVYKNNTYFISNLCLEIKRNWIKSLWMSWFNSS